MLYLHNPVLILSRRVALSEVVSVNETIHMITYLHDAKGLKKACVDYADCLVTIWMKIVTDRDDSQIARHMRTLANIIVVCCKIYSSYDCCFPQHRSVRKYRTHFVAANGLWAPRKLVLLVSNPIADNITANRFLTLFSDKVFSG